MHGANGRMGEIQGQFPWLQNSFVCVNGNFSATPTPALRLKGKQDPLQTHGSKTEVQNAPICLLQKKCHLWVKINLSTFLLLTNFILFDIKTSQNIKHGAGKAKRAEALQRWLRQHCASTAPALLPRLPVAAQQQAGEAALTLRPLRAHCCAIIHTSISLLSSDLQLHPSMILNFDCFFLNCGDK